MAERVLVAQYHFKRENGNWPQDRTGAEGKKLQVREMSARSYAPLVEELDANRERYEYELREVDWTDGEEYRGSRELPILNPVRVKPLEERGLARVEREISSVEGGR